MITLKEIVKNGGMAEFSYACAGVLYYTVIIQTDGGVVEKYQFPVDMNDKNDVGTTVFVGSYKPITLMRYLRKAMESESLIKIK